MKKIFLPLISSSIIILPFLLISCSTSSDAQIIAETKKKIQTIVDSKPLPTLEKAIIGNNISLENFLQKSDFIPPLSNDNGIEIKLNNIEIPLLGSDDFIIWFKVESIDTYDIAPGGIFDFYSVNFKSIPDIKDKIINPITNQGNLKMLLQNLIDENNLSINNFISEAINGTGYFSDQIAIDTSSLNTNPEELNNRLTTEKIDQLIFQNTQKNIYAYVNNFNEINQKISMKFTLGINIDDSNQIFYDRDFFINMKIGAI